MTISGISASTPAHSSITASGDKPELTDAEKRERIKDNLPKNTLIAGGTLATAGTLMSKLHKAPWGRAAAVGAVAGGIGAVTNLASNSVAYMTSDPELDSSLIKNTGTGVRWGLYGVGMLAAYKVAMSGNVNPLAGLAKAGAAGAAGAGATGGKSMLSQFGTDLTEAARKGEIGRAFGVDDKVDELVAVLGAKKKNNPLIVGPAGTGKSALVEELAHRVASGEVPAHLKGVKIVQIDLDAMVGGTRYRGMFEQRLSGVLKEIEASNGKIIPFIDETHKLVNAGAAGNIDGAGEAVKPLLARGKIRLIGATTDAKDEIGAIHADPALTRRFTELSITAPSSESTLHIIRSSAKKFEPQGMRFTDDALRATVELTDPIVSRNQPDKALTLLDTAASRINIARDAKPPQLKELQAQIATAKSELAIVSRESGEASKARATQLQATLAELEPQAAELHSSWSAAREARDAVVSAARAVRNATPEDDKAALDAALAKARAALVPHRAAHPHMFQVEITRADILATPLPMPASEQAKQGAKQLTRRNPVGFAP